LVSQNPHLKTLNDSIIVADFFRFCQGAVDCNARRKYCNRNVAYSVGDEAFCSHLALKFQLLIIMPPPVIGGGLIDDAVWRLSVWRLSICRIQSRKQRGWGG